MLFHPQFTDLGPLELVEVYACYDRPLLVACQNASGHLYLAVMTHEDDAAETWLYVGVSQLRLDLVRIGAMDLHDAFALAESGIGYTVSLPRESERPASHSVVNVADLDDDGLPAAGERLNMSLNTVAKRTDDLTSRALQGRRVYAGLRLQFPDMRRTEAPAAWLGGILTTFQDALSAIGQATVGAATARGSIPKKVLTNTEMSVTGFSAGSFEVEMASSSLVDLFDESEAGEALKQLADLIDIGSDADRLKERLEELKIRVASKYLQFLKSLVDRVAVTSLEWAAPKIGLSGHAQIASATTRAAIKIIEQADLQPPQEIAFVGTLIGANVDKRTFEIWATNERGEKTSYAGGIADSAYESARVATLSQQYAVIILQTSHLKLTTSDVDIDYELLELMPPE